MVSFERKKYKFRKLLFWILKYFKRKTQYSTKMHHNLTLMLNYDILNDNYFKWKISDKLQVASGIKQHS